MTGGRGREASLFAVHLHSFKGQAKEKNGMGTKRCDKSVMSSLSLTLTLSLSLSKRKRLSGRRARETPEGMTASATATAISCDAKLVDGA